MKKTILILLSLILLFSFVSCNGSTNSPSSNDTSDTNKVPSIEPDKNVPPAEQFESATSSDCANILLALQKINSQTPNSYGINREINVKLTAKEGAEINSKALIGTVTVTNKTTKEEYSTTYNGTCNIGDTSYEFSDYKILSHGPSGVPNVLGLIKKDGNPVDLNNIGEDDDLYVLLNNFNVNYFYSQLVSATGNLYANLNSSDFVGGVSSNISASGNNIVSDVIANFSKLSIGDSQDHSLTAEYRTLTNIITGAETLQIKYISFDNHYFTAESVLSDENLKNYIYNIF